VSLVAVGCGLHYEVPEPSTLLVSVAAARTPYQGVLTESFALEPRTASEERIVGFEDNRIFRVSAPAGPLAISYVATVELRPSVEDPPKVQEAYYATLRPDVLPYLHPSRYCESDRLLRFANQEFGHLLPGYSRVTAVCNWTYGHLQYLPGSTTAHTTACDVLVQRTGVCRDYAHLAIALCRALCIPARYVSVYAVGLEPLDFHGVFEAYLGDRWYLFDASRRAPVGGFVRIGTGRDAADASFATILGLARMTGMTVWCRDTTGESTTGGLPFPSSDAAVSTA